MADDKKDEEAFVLEQVELDDDDDDITYEEVPLDESESEEEPEDFEKALEMLKRKTTAVSIQSQPVKAPAEPSLARRQELIDDFIRNFLVKMGLQRTLDMFQTEWFELTRKGKLRTDEMGPVPDIYVKNQQLEDMISSMQAEVERAKEVAEKARGTWEKLRKERDFHRMHHKRVVQEKNKLLVDLKRVKKHYSNYEPAIAELRHKYEVAMKEKMLMRLERDRLSAKVEGLEATIKQLEAMKAPSAQAETDKKAKKKGKDSTLPAEDRVNPYLNLSFEPANAERMNLTKTFKGHTRPISAMALHPKKAIVATVSDDATWKMWALPNGDLIMSGDGHKDWVAGCDFHPRGTHLATGSGDGTVKVWDFAHSVCAATFTDHTQAVWSVAFHDLGDFLVSASMDHTAKVWDLNSQRCRQTLRGHVDSINCVTFQPFSNFVCTGSGDKTVSLWDIRTGLCIQTFYGHQNACNHATFNLKGDTIASTDADGVVKLWDVRMVQERGQFQTSVHPANKCAFDRSGHVLAVACDDAIIRIYNMLQNRLVQELKGHEDAVQSVVFDPFGKYLLSSGSDCSFRMWS
eukprot:tig00021319_g20248.t1